MRRPFAWWVFWGAVASILYSYIGFPILTAVRGWLIKRPVQRDPSYLPTVSIIIAAYNEAEVIGKKLENTLALDYPTANLEVLVASDGSDDGTDLIVAAIPDPRIRLFALPRQGKNRTLNSFVPHARGDVLVFTDADSMLAPDALRQLVAPLADPTVGAVGGDYRYAATVEDGVGERTYWSFDRQLKQWQSQAGSMTSATGQIYAIRRTLWEKVPLSVTDDFYTSVRAPIAHQRLVFEPKAVAVGPDAASADAEFKRKVRVMSRGLNAVWLSRRALNPFNYGFYAVQLFSHKVLRRLMVLPLLLIGITAPVLWNRGLLYKLITIGQLGLHAAAALGFATRGTKLGRQKFLSLPYFFDMVNAAAFIAFLNLLRGKRYDLWLSQRGTTELTSNGKLPTERRSS